jgi:hypothetical protein
MTYLAANQDSGSQRDSQRDDSSMGNQDNRGTGGSSGNMDSSNMGSVDSDWQ